LIKKIADKITITGADDTIAPISLLQVAEESPYVEFGLLLSKKRMGSKEFPSLRWMMELNEIMQHRTKMALSGHICGQWVRDICLGKEDFFKEYPFWRIFSRLQLNFGGERYEMPDPDRFLSVIKTYAQERQFIFQIDGVNDGFFTLVKKLQGIDVVPLFDLSGGTGRLPEKWPQYQWYSGYAWGLSPDNLSEQMGLIAEVVGPEPIWVDAQAAFRPKDNMLFDLSEVRRFTRIARPWVIGY